MLKQWLTRLRFLLAPKPHDEIDEESQFHLEEQTKANVATGMTPQEARRQAVISFGGVESAKEASHQQRPSFLSKPWFRIFATPSAASPATPYLLSLSS